MKVSKLIAKLSEYDPNDTVVIDGGQNIMKNIILWKITSVKSVLYEKKEKPMILIKQGGSIR